MFPAGDSLGTYARQLPLEEPGWAYHVEYRGRFPMSPEASIDIFTVTYDPFRFVPYLFTFLLLVSLAYFYVGVMIGNHKKI
jgi:hypothetical protein